MSLRNRIALPIAILSLAFLAACGGSSNKATPPPSGGFGLSNLNGTYVFSTSGYDTNNSPIMFVGAFSANGSGAIGNTGAFTLVDPANTTPVISNQAITGGSYSITADGRGQVHLTNSVSGLGTLTFDFVLSSTSGGSITFYTSIGTGSGTLDLQTSSATQSSIDGQPYAFLISGVGSNGPIATGGAFTLSSSGAVATGVQDITVANTSSGSTLVSSETGIALSSSSGITLGTGGSAGAAILGQFSFDVYAIDATHLKLIETDGLEYTVGDVLAQGSSLPTGVVAFTMAGLDSATSPLAVGGILQAGATNLTGSLEDFNDAGNVGTSTTVSGGFSALSGGRGTLTLGNFENGATDLVLSTYTFAVYPTTSGVLMLEIDNAGISTGIGLSQTNTTFASSQGYGLNLSAFNASGYEEDDIAEFTSTSSGFSGLVDVNDQGSLYPDKLFDGTYQSSGTGRYTFTANPNSSFNGVSGVFYTVDGTNFLLIEGDSTQVGGGSFQLQSASGTPSAAAVPRFKISRGLHVSAERGFKPKQ